MSVFERNDLVFLDGEPGTIVARVRKDDDPRKCVPFGYQFARKGDIAMRDEVSYLVELLEGGSLRWSFRKELCARIDAPIRVGRSRASAVLEDVKAISTGTMSYLTGFREYTTINETHRAFIQHVIATMESGVRYENWIEAWRWFVNGEVAERFACYTEIDRLFTVSFRPGAGKGQADILVESRGGKEAISCHAPLGSLEELIAAEVDWNAGNCLVRLGFVKRHWVGPKGSDLMDEWARNRWKLAKAA